MVVKMRSIKSVGTGRCPWGTRGKMAQITNAEETDIYPRIRRAYRAYRESRPCEIPGTVVLQELFYWQTESWVSLSLGIISMRLKLCALPTLRIFPGLSTMIISVQD